MLNDDALKLQALKYAESKKIVNQRSIDAYIAGYRLRHSATKIMELEKMINDYKQNHDSAQDDCGYGDLRGESFNRRISEGSDALKLSQDLEVVKGRILEFNKKYNRQ